MSYDDDPDAWIWDENETVEHFSGTHTFDGSVCPICNIVHVIESNVPVDNIPPEVLSELDKMMESLPSGARVNAKVIAVEKNSGSRSTASLISLVLETCADFQALSYGAAQILDLITDNMVSKTLDASSMKAKMIALRIAYSSTSHSLKSFHEDVDNVKSSFPGNPEEYIELLEAHLVKLRVDIDKIKEEYSGIISELPEGFDSSVIYVDGYEVPEPDDLSAIDKRIYSNIVSDVSRFLLAKYR